MKIRSAIKSFIDRRIIFLNLIIAPNPALLSSITKNIQSGQKDIVSSAKKNLKIGNLNTAPVNVDAWQFLITGEL